MSTPVPHAGGVVAGQRAAWVGQPGGAKPSAPTQRAHLGEWWGGGVRLGGGSAERLHATCYPHPENAPARAPGGGPALGDMARARGLCPRAAGPLPGEPGRSRRVLSGWPSALGAGTAWGAGCGPCSRLPPTPTRPPASTPSLGPGRRTCSRPRPQCRAPRRVRPSALRPATPLLPDRARPPTPAPALPAAAAGCPEAGRSPLLGIELQQLLLLLLPDKRHGRTAGAGGRGTSGSGPAAAR